MAVITAFFILFILFIPKISGREDKCLVKLSRLGRLWLPAKWARYARLMYPAILADVPNTLGNLQTTCFGLSDASEIFKQLVSAFPRPRKPSNNLFRPFRPLGNLQTTCFGLSDASETFKQLVLAFPTPRKPSNNLFRPFRCVGNLQTTCFGLSDASETFKQLVSAFPTPRGVRDACQVCWVRVFEVPGQLPCPGRGRQGRLPSLPGTVFFEVPGQLPCPGRGRQGRLPSLPGTGFLRYPASLVDVPDAFGAAAPPSQGED